MTLVDPATRRLPLGHAWKYGIEPCIRIVLNGRTGILTLDTGANPSIIAMHVLAKYDPHFKMKLLPIDTATARGFGGQLDLIGVYPCQIILVHSSKDGSLALDIEFLVSPISNPPYEMLLGDEWQAVYGISIVRNPSSRVGPYIQVGTHPQRFAIPTFREPRIAGLTLSSRTALPSPSPDVARRFAPGNPSIAFSDFVKILQVPVQPSAEFEQALLAAHINPALSAVEQEQLRRVLLACEDAFALKDKDFPMGQLGDVLKLDITVPSPLPRILRKAPYPLSNKARQDIRETCEELLRRGLIRPSNSPVAAPALMVYKGDKKRMVQDYRAINEYIKAPANPLPHLFSSLQTVQKAKFFTSIDIKDAFYYMVLHPDSVQWTAFVTPDGLYEWVRAGFGISSFPPEFQRRISDLFYQEIKDDWFRIYIDDGLINSEDFSTHLWQLFIVLRSLIQPGCRVALHKCFFGYPELHYLGHKLNGITIGLDDGRTAAIRLWAPPTNVKSLMSFLGFTGYHRNFIPKYAWIIHPLQELIPKAHPWDWGTAQQEAFQAIKDALINAVILHRPDFGKAFVVYTDASFVGIAAGLYQDFDGTECPIAFISRQLRKGELRYGATQLECLAVVWMLEKFHFYLDGAHFTVVTDCTALKSLLTAKWCHRHMIRWQAAIQDYRGRMTIVHRAGRLNANADGPSRAALPNTPDNPAANLEVDDTIEIGGITLRSSRHDRLGPSFYLPAPSSPSALEEGGLVSHHTTPTTPQTEIAQTEIAQTEIAQTEIDQTETDQTELTVQRAKSSKLFSDHEIPVIAALCNQINDSYIFGFADSDLSKVSPDIALAAISTHGLTPELMERVKLGYETKPEIVTVLKLLSAEEMTHDHLLRELESSKVKMPFQLKDELLAGNLSCMDGLLYRHKNLHTALVVVDDATQALILDLCHDHGLSGHFGADRTRHRVESLAWWPLLRAKVDDYCRTCDACQSAKRRTGKGPGLLQKIDVPPRPWSYIHMDFVTALPTAGPLDSDAVMVVTDRLSRMVRFIPCRKSHSAKDIALLYNLWILSMTGVPEILISDRDPKFTADFWQTLHKLLGTRLAMSTAHHAQTDGLAERHIGTLEEALRTFCSFGQIQDREGISMDWVAVLPQLEFAYNSSVHATTGQIPFQTAFGWVPSGPPDLIKAAANIPTEKLDPSSLSWAELIATSRERARASIDDAFEHAKARWDKHHRNVDFSKFKQARLSTKYFKFSDVADKLKDRWIGPFDIVKCKGPNAVQLHLTEPYTRRHPVFPVSLLKPVHNAKYQYPERRRVQQAQPVLVHEDGDEEWEIANIIGQKRIRDPGGGTHIEYEVRWKDWDPTDTSWLTEDKLNAPDLLREWRRNYRHDEKQLPNTILHKRRSKRQETLSSNRATRGSVSLDEDA